MYGSLFMKASAITGKGLGLATMAVATSVVRVNKFKSITANTIHSISNDVDEAKKFSKTLRTEVTRSQKEKVKEAKATSKPGTDPEDIEVKTKKKSGRPKKSAKAKAETA